MTGTTVNARRCTTQDDRPGSVEFSKILTTAEVDGAGEHRLLAGGRGRPGHAPPGTWSTRPSPTASRVGLDLLDPFTPVQPDQRHQHGFSVRSHDHPHAQRLRGRQQPGAHHVELVRWVHRWPGARRARSRLNTLVAEGTPPASVQNVASLTSDSLSTALQRIADLAITSETLLRGQKEVRGDRDTGFLSFPGIGQHDAGRLANYRATIRNVSDVAVRNVIVVDTLPIPGDIGARRTCPPRLPVAAALRRRAHRPTRRPRR